MWKSTAWACSWVARDLLVENVHRDSGHRSSTMSLRTRPHSCIPSCRGPYPVHRSTFTLSSPLSQESKWPKFFFRRFILLPLCCAFIFWVKFFVGVFRILSFFISNSNFLGMIVSFDFNFVMRGFVLSWYSVFIIWMTFQYILHITKYRNNVRAENFPLKEPSFFNNWKLFAIFSCLLRWQNGHL